MTLVYTKNVTKHSKIHWYMEKKQCREIFHMQKKKYETQQSPHDLSKKSLSIVLLQGQCLQTLQGPLHAFQKNIVHIVGRRIARGTLHLNGSGYQDVIGWLLPYRLMDNHFKLKKLTNIHSCPLWCSSLTILTGARFCHLVSVHQPQVFIFLAILTFLILVPSWWLQDFLRTVQNFHEEGFWKSNHYKMILVGGSCQTHLKSSRTLSESSTIITNLKHLNQLLSHDFQLPMPLVRSLPAAKPIL